MHKLLLITLILECQISFGWDCNSISQDEDFEFSDLVFFGRVIDVNDTSYRIKVLESYKGDAADTLVGLLRDFTPLPEKGSLWLIYGKGDRTTFIVPMCSGSKSLDKPFGLHDASFPMPPPRGLWQNESFLAIFDALQKEKSLNEFYFEIASLREKVKKSDIDGLTEKLDQLTTRDLQQQGEIRLMRNMNFGLMGGIILLLILQLTNRKNSKHHSDCIMHAPQQRA